MHYERAARVWDARAGGSSRKVSERIVHKEATVIAVLNGSGKLVMESIVESKASSILQFVHGLRGELHVTWAEGTWAAWLYDLLQPRRRKCWSAIRGAMPY